MSERKIISSPKVSYADQVLVALSFPEVKEAVIADDSMNKYYVCYILNEEDGWFEIATEFACETMQDLKVTFDGVEGQLCYVDEALMWIPEDEL